MIATSALARLAIAEASEAYCKRVRARFGLTPQGAPTDPAAMPGLAYCGREFRAYPSMRIADAVRFYAALHARWNAASLREYLAIAGLDERLEIRRMKRAFQRALVLALVLASVPVVLIVENAEEFDEERCRALLARAVASVPRSIVLYGVNVTHPLAGMPEAIDAGSFDPGSL